jgi:hypothetical protein
VSISAFSASRCFSPAVLLDPEVGGDVILGTNCWRYIPEDRTLYSHRCENFKSNFLSVFFPSLGWCKVGVFNTGKKSWHGCLVCHKEVNKSCTSGYWNLRTSLYLLVKRTPWPLVRNRTTPTERPPIAGEVGFTFSLSCSQRTGPSRPFISVF